MELVVSMYQFSLISLLFFTLLLAATTYYKSTRRFKDAQTKQHTHDMARGFIDNPKFVRDLAKHEIEVLQNLQKSFLPQYMKSFHKIFNSVKELALFFIILIVLKLYVQIYINNFDYRIATYALVVLFLISIAAYILLQKYKIYLDMRSPVLGTTGKLFVYWGGNLEMGGTYFIIRDIQIDYNLYPDISEYLLSIPEGNRVYIEYSPHTKHVWSVKEIPEITDNEHKL